MMPAIRLQVFSLAALILVTACSKKDSKDEPKQAEARALSLSGFKDPSFASVSWDKHCAAIDQFLSDFTAKHMPGASLQYTKGCERNESSVVSDNVEYQTSPVFSKDGEKVEIMLILRSYFNSKEGVFTKHDVTGIIVEREPKKLKPFAISEREARIGENLRHLPATMLAWTQTDASQPSKVFDIPYLDYVKAVEKAYNFDSEGLLVDDGKVKVRVQLQGHADNFAYGNLRFLEVDAAALEAGFFNCKTLECLNESGAHYELYGTRLYLVSGKGPLTSMAHVITSWNP